MIDDRAAAGRRLEQARGRSLLGTARPVLTSRLVPGTDGER
jgi:hypothetical protein